jgi:hypothetical protein
MEPLMVTEQTNKTPITSGTVGGLFTFLDFLMEKGYATANSVNVWRSAARQVFSTVDGDTFESVDIRAIDPDEYFLRFENMTVGQYKEESLASYRSRFRKSLDAYLGYLEERRLPTFRGSGGRSAAGAKKSKPAGEASSPRPARAEPMRQRPTVEVGPELVDYPFPLRSGGMVHLYLPPKLEKGDADRLAAFVQTLVIEPQRQLPAPIADS